MKKLMSLILMTFFAVTISSNAETKVNLEIAGDAYYATDNAKIGMGERLFTTTNVKKDQFGINNALFTGNAEGDFWRAKIAVGYLDQGGIVPEEANVALKLFGDLWIEGGYYTTSMVGDADYTYNSWFTSNSLTDVMGCGYQTGIGLFYEITPDITVRLRAINSAYTYDRTDNNRSKSFMVSGDFNDLFNGWNMSVGGMFGNEMPLGREEETMVLAAANFNGFFIKDFEGSFTGKFASFDDATAFSIQALARYHFNEKFALGARIAYTGDEDGIFIGSSPLGGSGLSGLDFGIVGEYNPTPFTYVRLEGNLLNMMNSDNDLYAEVFQTGDTDVSAMRVGVALSMGFKFDLFNRTIQ